VNDQLNLKSVALHIPEIMAIEVLVLGGGCEPPILRKRKLQGGGDGTVRKSVGELL